MPDSPCRLTFHLNGEPIECGFGALTWHQRLANELSRRIGCDADIDLIARPLKDQDPRSDVIVYKVFIPGDWGQIPGSRLVVRVYGT